jgi:hypothetical protein
VCQTQKAGKIKIKNQNFLSGTCGEAYPLCNPPQIPARPRRQDGQRQRRGQAHAAVTREKSCSNAIT